MAQSECPCLYNYRCACLCLPVCLVGELAPWVSYEHFMQTNIQKFQELEYIGKH